VCETYSSGTKRLGKESWHAASMVCASSARTMREHNICVVCFVVRGFKGRSNVDFGINRLLGGCDLIQKQLKDSFKFINGICVSKSGIQCKVLRCNLEMYTCLARKSFDVRNDATVFVRCDLWLESTNVLCTSRIRDKLARILTSIGLVTSRTLRAVLARCALIAPSRINIQRMEVSSESSQASAGEYFS
jgi:hypothetical protein